HNEVEYNVQLLEKVPGIDLIIGGHDHQKLTEPQVVHRKDGSQAWVVETGAWGKFLGKVTLTLPVSRTSIYEPRVKLESYELLQVDRSIPEDGEINSRLEDLEDQLKAKFGNDFFDRPVAHSHIHVDRTGIESLMGNLVTDSYFSAVDADLALNHIKYISGEL